MSGINVFELEKLENAPSSRYGHSTVIVGNFLYLFGGCSPDGKEFYSEMYILNLVEMKWVEKIDADKKYSRHFHSCDATSDDPENCLLIIFGGKSNGYKNDVCVFDTKKKEFQTIEPKYKDSSKVSSCVNADGGCLPPTGRYAHSSCYYDQKVFIFGGYDTINMWKKFVIAKIPYRYHHSGVLIDGNYFIIGGITKKYEPLSDVFRLDLTQASQLEEDDHGVEAFEVTITNPVASYGQKCFVLEGKIYMYGGRDKTKEFKHLLRLDFGHGNLKWEAEKEIQVDETKLTMSYGSLDVYNNNNLLFFGGQYRGEKKGGRKVKVKEEEEEGEEEEIMDVGDELPYDCIFEILSFLDEKSLLLVCGVSKKWTFSLAARTDRIWEKRYKTEIKNSSIDSFSKKKVKRQKSTYQKFRMLRHQEYLNRKKLEKMRPLAGVYNVPGSENIKMVCVGDGAVGKTCLLIAYANGTFPDDYVPTVFDNYNAIVNFENGHVCLGLWDTGGEEDYDLLRPLSYPETNVFLLCFSLVDKSSLDACITKWYPELTQHASGVPIVLCGTKSDLLEDKKFLEEMKTSRYEYYELVKREEALEVAKKIKAVKYIETSAKTQKGVLECFYALIAAVLAPEGLDSEKKKDEKCGIM